MRFALHKIIATVIKAKAVGNIRKERDLKLLKMSRTQEYKSAAEQGRNEATAVAGDSVGKTMTGRGTQQNSPNSVSPTHLNSSGLRERTFKKASESSLGTLQHCISHHLLHASHHHNDPKPVVLTYQISWISNIYIMIHKGSKITVK